jgi:membrane protein YqaA with SNARE-associated domain
MNTVTLEASGHIRFSWKSEHAISHFLHPLHLESSRAIQIGSFFFVKSEYLKILQHFCRVHFDLNVVLMMTTSLSLASYLSEKKASELDLQDIISWMMSLSVQYGYFGIFLISLVGAASIFFPIPYTVVVFTVAGFKNGSSWVFEPVWLAVAAGVGSALGEFSAYLVGLGGRKAISQRYKKKMDLLVRVFNRFGPVVIFAFSLTPLPDDLIFIPLGVMRYNIARAFLPALLGKSVMNLIVAYSGRFSIQYINSIFGQEGTLASALIGMVLAVVLTIVILIVIFKLDWEKYLQKYLERQEENDRKLKQTSENRKE